MERSRMSTVSPSSSPTPTLLLPSRKEVAEMRLFDHFIVPGSSPETSAFHSPAHITDNPHPDSPLLGWRTSLEDGQVLPPPSPLGQDEFLIDDPTIVPTTTFTPSPSGDFPIADYSRPRAPTPQSSSTVTAPTPSPPAFLTRELSFPRSLKSDIPPFQPRTMLSRSASSPSNSPNFQRGGRDNQSHSPRPTEVPPQVQQPYHRAPVTPPPPSNLTYRHTNNIYTQNTKIPSIYAPAFANPNNNNGELFPHNQNAGLPDLPDPNLFPDPYPFLGHQHPHNAFTPPMSLSSAGSSSASARSSLAYTSPPSAIRSSVASMSISEFSHPSDEMYKYHQSAASGGGLFIDGGGEHEDNEEEGDVSIEEGHSGVGVGLTADEPVHLAHSSSLSSMSVGSSRARVTASLSTMNDANRWSGSSGYGNRYSDGSGLKHQPSNDWDAVDERDEFGLTTDESETDGDVEEEEDDEGDDIDDHDRTAAIVIAEEGRGLIVNGDGSNVLSLSVPAGTTHLLLSKSTTPNHIPHFLATHLPAIANTLLALDISCNYLASIPPALASCEILEELNIASNPLRALPIWLSNLKSLRVLIADATGCSTLPSALSGLVALHTLSVRRNRLYSLPAWLCKLTGLETLLVDGNPFQGPWKSLVEPLTPQVPSIQSPITPQSAFPPHTAQSTYSVASSTKSILRAEAEIRFEQQLTYSPETETLELSYVPGSNSPQRRPSQSQSQSPLPSTHPYARSNGIYPRSSSSPRNAMSMVSSASSTPHLDETYISSERAGPRPRMNQRPKTTMSNTGYRKSVFEPLEGEEEEGFDEDEPTTVLPRQAARRMKSADELRRAASTNGAARAVSPIPVPARFATLGVKNTGSPIRQTSPFWQESVAEDGSNPGEEEDRVPQSTPSTRPSSRAYQPDDSPPLAQSAGGKTGKWGFFKKMSMSRMRSTISASSSPQPPPMMTRAATTAGNGRRPGARTMASAPIVPRSAGGATPVGAGGFAGFAPGPNLGGSKTAPSSTQHTPSQSLLSVPQSSSAASSSQSLLAPSPTPRNVKRRSFLPLGDTGPPQLNIPIPSLSPFMPPTMAVGNTYQDNGVDDRTETPVRVEAPSPSASPSPRMSEEMQERERYQRALKMVMNYLRDMSDLGGGPSREGSMDEFPSKSSAGSSSLARQSAAEGSFSSATSLSNSSSSAGRPKVLRSAPSATSLRGGLSEHTADSAGSSDEKKFKEDKKKRANVIREIVDTERTYVKGLQELIDIYVTPSAAPISGLGNTKETVIPAAERKIVFNGLESLRTFHKDSFLPALEDAIRLLSKNKEDVDGALTRQVAYGVANVFVSHAAFMKMYSNYINNFDNSLARLKQWTTSNSLPSAVTPSSSKHVVGVGLTASGLVGVPQDPPSPHAPLSTSQKKRMKSFLKRCQAQPNHKQLNLEGYLLLPVQRIPRYKMMLDELLHATPPLPGVYDDPLERAYGEMASLASNMNEGKRDSESRKKLVHWQSRIQGKFASPLVQPHRRLIMDGYLHLSRVVRKTGNLFTVINSEGDNAVVQVECLAPEMTPRSLVALLCNDLLVLCKDPSNGKDPTCTVDLWAVLRMQTCPQPASVYHGNSLRLVDNRAILYFDTKSTSEALTWCKAINVNIPTSK